MSVDQVEWFAGGNKPAPVSLYPVQIPHDLTRIRRGAAVVDGEPPTNSLSYGTVIWTIGYCQFKGSSVGLWDH
jgi:hypothetical protein